MLPIQVSDKPNDHEQTNHTVNYNSKFQIPRVFPELIQVYMSFPEILTRIALHSCAFSTLYAAI